MRARMLLLGLMDFVGALVCGAGALLVPEMAIEPTYRYRVALGLVAVLLLFHAVAAWLSSEEPEHSP